MEVSNAFVCALGIGMVFTCLVCIVVICLIMGFVCRKLIGTKDEKLIPSNNAENSNTVQQPIENRQEIIAAVSAVIAEELGKDVSAIRILSFKKI